MAVALPCRAPGQGQTPDQSLSIKVTCHHSRSPRGCKWRRTRDTKLAKRYHGVASHSLWSSSKRSLLLWTRLLRVPILTEHSASCSGTSVISLYTRDGRHRAYGSAFHGLPQPCVPICASA